MGAEIVVFTRYYYKSPDERVYRRKPGEVIRAKTRADSAHPEFSWHGDRPVRVENSQKNGAVIYYNSSIQRQDFAYPQETEITIPLPDKNRRKVVASISYIKADSTFNRWSGVVNRTIWPQPDGGRLQSVTRIRVKAFQEQDNLSQKIINFRPKKK